MSESSLDGPGSPSSTSGEISASAPGAPESSASPAPNPNVDSGSSSDETHGGNTATADPPRTKRPAESGSTTINSHTINYVGENVHVATAASGGSQGFTEDPTDDYDDNPYGGIPRSGEHEVADFAARLVNKGVLIVSGKRRDVVKSAGIAVVSHLTQSHELKRRYLSISGTEAWNFSFLLKHTHHIKESAPGKADGGERAVVVVDINRADALAKLEGAWDSIENFGARKGKALYFVFLLCGEAARMVRARPELHNMPHWETEPLSFLLAAWGLSDLSGELCALLKKMPSEAQAQMFVDTVAETLKGEEGAKVLRDYAALWKNTGFQQWLEEKAPELGTGPCERAAAFLGAFFPNLPFTEFDSLIKLLLEGEKQELPVSPASPASAPAPLASNGNPPPIAAAPPPPATMEAGEFWRTRSKGVIEAAGLESVSDESGKRIVRFREPMLGRALRTNFPDDVFLLAQVDRLHEHDLLLDPRTPDETADAVAQITSEMFRRYPRRFDEEWLLQQVRDILQRLQQNVRERDARIETLPLPEVLKGLLKQLERTFDEHGRALSSRLFSRLTALCRALQTQLTTPDTLRRFLDRLIRETGGEGLLPLEVIWRLRGSSGFDHFTWLKHLLEVGSNETRLAVWNCLKQEAEGSAERQWTVLRQVAAWHPPGALPENGSQAHIWALAFLYDWAQSNMPNSWESPTGFFLRSEPEPVRDPQDGEGPAVPPGIPDLDARLGFLAAWLTHPGFAAALDMVLSKKGDFTPPFASRSDAPPRLFVDCCLAEILEGWHAHPAQAPAIAALVGRLKRLWTNERLQNLRMVIGKHVDVLLKNASHPAQRDQRPKLMARRQQALALAKLLQPERPASPAAP